MTRTRERDAQWATLDAHRENAARGRPAGRSKDATAVLHMPGVDDTVEALERREAALKITDMAAGQHDCGLDPDNSITVCSDPEHERDADWARMALDVLGLNNLTDDEADLDLVPEPAPERDRYDARLNRSSFTRPEWGWQDSAACQGEDLVLFFGPEGERQPEREIRERKAKQICFGCPVRTECGEYALTRPEKYGTWAAMGEEEREVERRKFLRRKRAAA